MKKIIAVFLFIIVFSAPSFAATVGSPEMTIPEEALFLKREAVKKALDEYQYNLNIKVTPEIEIITSRKLTSADDSTGMKLKGQTYMLKLSNNYLDVFEPYVKVGTCDLKVKWTQHGESITVDTKPDFIWTLGAKAKLWESRNWGVKLTLDAQYRSIDVSVDSTSKAGAMTQVFDITEIQTAILASKKFVLPIGMRDYYVAPYGGITMSWLDADVSFEDSSQSGPPYPLYSTYNATDKDPIGLVLGFDVMPSLLNWYLINFELRLITETALTFGGTIKF